MSAAIDTPLSPNECRTTGAPSLCIVNPIDLANWDDLVATHPGATFFHSRAWARTLVATYGFDCRYILAARDGRMAGLLPVMEARSWIRGVRGVSLPFTDNCPALVSEEVPHESLLKAAVNDSHSRGWKHIDFCGEQPDSASSLGDSYFGHRLILAGGAEQMFHALDSSVRRAIRKAERSGVKVEFSTSLEALKSYYRLHCRTRTRHGAPPQPFRFFQSIFRHILDQGHGFVALATLNGRPISGAVFFLFAGKALYKFSASDERFQLLRGANLVIWRSIEKLFAAGARELDFGRTSKSNEGLRRFKLGWGAGETIVHQLRYSVASRRFVAVRDLASGLHTRVCASLPIFVSRWVGTLAYPHMT